jgi:hypothetical protein
MAWSIAVPSAPVRNRRELDRASKQQEALMLEEVLAPFEEVLGVVPGGVWLIAGFALGVGFAGVLRPAAKAALKACMDVGDRAQGMGAGAAERAQDLVAEARSERRRPTRPSARAARTRRPRPTPASAARS